MYLMPKTTALKVLIYNHFLLNLMPTNCDCLQQDTEVRGFVIPRGATVFGNLYHVMRDPDYWQRPDDFLPERFIDSDGQFRPDERVVPFSVGKRQCPGQQLAEKEFFLFFAGKQRMNE